MTSHSAYGSYVQLSTFDDKDKSISEKKPSFVRSRNPKRFLITRRDVIIVLVILVCAVVIISTTLSIGLPKIREKKLKYLDTSFPVSSAPLKVFDNAVVLTDGKPCAPIGKSILQKGGSAVDAAIASLFCDGVVNPQSMGLGGGFLMTVYSKEKGTSEIIDARETAPIKSTQNMFNGNATLALEGGLAVAVPGELRGYWLAHEKYGKLNWSELVQPSVMLCNNGFEVSQHLGQQLKRFKDKILADSSLREEFYNNETNDVYKENEILRRPVLANTLKEIAEKGADVLYTGNLSREFVKDIQKCGGIINETDLEMYQPKSKEAIIVQLRDGLTMKSLHTVPPPGSGLILALILNILDGYNINSKDMENVDKTVNVYHRIVEAFKYAFAYRTQLGDEDFINVTELVANLTSREFAEIVRQKISDTETFSPEHYQPVMDSINDHGTAHVSVLTANGDAVSATSTINTYFGSLCRSKSTGIILNNDMDDFSSPNITNYFGVPPSPANFIAPGKRPLSSMSPSILVDSNGQVRMVVGGAGGTHIITSSALSMIRVMWLNEDIKRATDAPRIHHQLFPNYIEYENAFPKIYLDKLQKYGHSVQPTSQSSVVLGIVRSNGKLQTNVDYRKGGSVDGY